MIHSVKWPSTREGGEYRAISEERWKSSSSLAGCREMAKYQGWRGVQGNFRGKVEERVQQKGNRRGGAGPGWLAAAPTTGPRKKQRKGGKVS